MDLRKSAVCRPWPGVTPWPGSEKRIQQALIVESHEHYLPGQLQSCKLTLCLAEDLLIPHDGLFSSPAHFGLAQSLPSLCKAETVLGGDAQVCAAVLAYVIASPGA